MKYIIHRGVTSKNIEENSYTAIKKALRHKEYEGVEFDIRLTKDKKIVLSHNSYIDNKKIENTNYLEIIRDKYLTTLDKILTIDTNKILLIDIKVNKNYKIFANTLIKELKNNKNRNLYLASFNKKIISYLRHKTNYKLGLIFFYKKNVSSYDFAVINSKTVNNGWLNKNNDKEIFIWTINNSNEEKELIKKINNIEKYYLIINK